VQRQKNRLMLSETFHQQQRHTVYVTAHELFQNLMYPNHQRFSKGHERYTGFYNSVKRSGIVLSGYTTEAIGRI
jgi:hypothetical protein